MKNMNIGGLLYIDSDEDFILMEAESGSKKTVNIKELIHN